MHGSRRQLLWPNQASVRELGDPLRPAEPSQIIFATEFPGHRLNCLTFYCIRGRFHIILFVLHTLVCLRFPLLTRQSPFIPIIAVYSDCNSALRYYTMSAESQERRIRFGCKISLFQSFPGGERPLS